MTQQIILSVATLLTLVPALGWAWRPAAAWGDRPDGPFWLGLGFGVVGPVALVATRLGTGWQTGLSSTLWVTVAVCAALYAMLCLTRRSAWRLSPLVLPYLMAIGFFATLAHGAPHGFLSDGLPRGWIAVHITVSVVTYALLTLSAIAAVGGVIQDRALSKKRPSRLSPILPSLVACERLQFHLLMTAELVLGLGLLTGIALLHAETGALIRFDHKTLFSIAAFVVIGVLLLVHARTGARGRGVARIVLVAYLLLTLAYPGVKFVRDVLAASVTA